VRPYDSGPGRKWLFFVFGAGTAAFLALVGLRRGDQAAFHIGWVMVVLGFTLAAIRARRLGVMADEEGVTVRTWAHSTRYAWEDVKTVFGTPERPVLVLRTGAEVVLLDNWHHDPSSVGAEVRRRLLASRDSTSR
jgi:predicted alpha/beta hydrolase